MHNEISNYETMHAYQVNDYDKEFYINYMERNYTVKPVKIIMILPCFFVAMMIISIFDGIINIPEWLFYIILILGLIGLLSLAVAIPHFIKIRQSKKMMDKLRDGRFAIYIGTGVVREIPAHERRNNSDGAYYRYCLHFVYNGNVRELTKIDPAMIDNIESNKTICVMVEIEGIFRPFLIGIVKDENVLLYDRSVIQNFNRTIF